MRKLVAVLAGIGLLIAASSAMALSTNGWNDSRPYATFGSSGEDSLQTILDSNFGKDTINAINDQSSAGAWTLADSGASISYLVDLFSAATLGKLYIYSKVDPTKFSVLINTDSQTQRSFSINSITGNLTVGDTSFSGFGTSFGFFWESYYSGFPDQGGIQRGYTEDYLNAAGYGPDSKIKALTYIVPEGTALIGNLAGFGTAHGNDDWVLAFEDFAPGGDHDFNDAVFYVKDLAPVPEPGTILLLGAGLLGLGFYGRRRMKKA